MVVHVLSNNRNSEVGACRLLDEEVNGAAEEDGTNCKDEIVA
jgi:hypothetical protein